MLIMDSKSFLKTTHLQFNLTIQAQGVLVVEDSPLQRSRLVNMLHAFGIDNVVTAADGNQALDLVDYFSPMPAVIVLDLELPGMDGIEVLQKLAEQNLKSPLILLSSMSEVLISSVVTMAEAWGFPLLGAFRKPITPSDLADALRNFSVSSEATPNIEEQNTTIDVDELERGLELWEIQPYYQPKIDLQTGQFNGVEALVRWIKSGQVIRPIQFVPFAEKTGLIDKLTLCVLDQALNDMLFWRRAGIAVPVAINFSAPALSLPGLADTIIQRVFLKKIAPEMITFEVTENALVSDLGSALMTANRLCLRGFKFAIDDYGTGFSSLQWLSEFPFSELKIDRRFVQSAIHRPYLRMILQSAIEMGQHLGFTTVGEGVELKTELELLKSLGCGLAQGNLIAEPMPRDKIVDWYRREFTKPRAQYSQRE